MMTPSHGSARKGAEASDRKRKLAFASAAVVLLGITAFLTLGDSGSLRWGDSRSERPAGQSAIRTGSPAVSEPGGTTDPRGSPSPASAGAVDRAVRQPAHRETKAKPEARPPSRPATRARRPPRLARSSRDTCRTATAALTRSGFGRPRSRCCASWRRPRRECRRASPALARSSSPCVPRRRPAVRTSTSWPWSRMAGGGTASRSRCGTRVAAGS